MASDMIGPATSGTPVDAVAAEINTLGMTDDEKKAREDIEVSVKKFFKQFDEDQKFDKPIREQRSKDRNYASGETQAAWAVSTNLVGSAIDVLVSTLYARDPDVSARAAPNVDPPPDETTGMVPPQPQRQTNNDMAKSMEIVLSRLWKKGKLKTRMRRVLRSVLSAGHGWLKVLPITDTRPDPLAQNEYNTLQANYDSVQAQLTALEAGQTLDGQTASIDDLTAQKQALATSIEALSNKLEVEICYGFTFDVVKPEHMQVGTDVELLEEYLDADSNTELMYFPHDQLREKFPDLKDEDLKTADKFYRKAPRNANKGEGDNMEGEMIARMYPKGDTDELYTSVNPQDGARPLALVLEKWHKVDNHIYTAIKGVKVWARAPYQPSFASSRWYPYFYFSLYEVDGSRAPQSLSSRLAKLNDEFGSVRSNLRITRRRSIPGTIVDASALSDEELEKIQKGVIAEITALRSTLPGADFSKMFAAKPVPNIDMRLYDTAPIIADLERTAGVQEANQAVSTGGTATEAQIQQAGFNSRTESSRDTIETTLGDLANFCGEVSLQKIPPDIAAKIAGPAVFWPSNLPLEDILSMLEIEISAGTTGKPKSQGDRDAWGVILPQLQQLTTEIFSLQQNQQTLPLATALSEQVRETMRRFGDESDLDRFLPAMPAVPMLPPVGPPGAPPPGAEGAPPPEGAPPAGAPPEGPPGSQMPSPPALIPEAAAPGFFGPS